MYGLINNDNIKNIKINGAFVKMKQNVCIQITIIYNTGGLYL